MTHEKFFKLHFDLCTRLQDIVRAKNTDYTCATSDPFANFKAVEALGIATPVQGLLTRMTDKLSRAASLTSGNKPQAVLNESLEDTLLDLANYALLLTALIKDEKESNEKNLI